jgi:uncharacterized protein (TIRG00374 family)
MKSARLRLIALTVIVLFLAALLLGLALRGIPFQDVVNVLAVLHAWQVATILLLNTGIVLLFALRWWQIIRAQGYYAPYLAVVRYYLTGFAISYLTPGQHFGGEPVQVLFLRQRHKIPGSQALASVALDRAITFFSNFAVLAVGIALILGSGLLDVSPLRQALPVSVALLLLPALYLALLRWGVLPFGLIFSKFTVGIIQGLRRAEQQLSELVRKKPILFVQGLGLSTVIWATLFLEFWLMIYFLGLTVNPMQLLTLVVAGRLALWVPTPGALGALEASQVIAMQALGFDPAYGLGLALFIRSRDILFAVFGLLLGGAEGLSAYRRSPR